MKKLSTILDSNKAVTDLFVLVSEDTQDPIIKIGKWYNLQEAGRISIKTTTGFDIICPVYKKEDCIFISEEVSWIDVIEYKNSNPLINSIDLISVE